MPKIDAAMMERYRKMLTTDPSSQVFAVLAEALRERGELKEAERMARNGVQRHPKFSSGLLVLGKVLKDQKRYQDAANLFETVIEMDSQNLLAYQNMGDVCLEMAQPKEALKYYKMVLFLNPQSSKAQKVVQKLESLTADEYEEDVFEMAPITQVKAKTGLGLVTPNPPPPQTEPLIKPKAPGEISRGLQRMLSLIDAFIVRNDLSRAQHLLSETEVEFGEHAEISMRRKMLYNRQASQLNQDDGSLEKIGPIMGREAAIRKKKLDLLQSVLRVIEQTKSPDLAT
jgi:tetratricopeptide (TPR) repeat protein